jgi:hypothetical protein
MSAAASASAATAAAASQERGWARPSAASEASATARQAR